MSLAFFSHFCKTDLNADMLEQIVSRVVNFTAN